MFWFGLILVICVIMWVAGALDLAFPLTVMICIVVIVVAAGIRELCMLAGDAMVDD